MTLTSFVVPCYNEEESLPLFFLELEKAIKELKVNYLDMRFELILVDDGSSDSTVSVIEELASKAWSFEIRWMSFSRNFGKEAALYAGLKNAKGDYVATMDADLQDPPSLLPEMFNALLSSDFDNVATRRVDREGEPPIRSFFSRLFYKLINHISSADIVDGARDYRLMRRKMVDAVISMAEYNRFSKGIYGWVGFKTKWLSFKNVQRAAGETKWSFFSLLLYSIDGIVAFSTVPLYLASVIGIALCFLAFVFIVAIICKTLIIGDPVDGWPSLACIVVFLGGLQLFCLGVLGQYLAKTYLEVKRRPIYIVREANFACVE